MPESGDLDGQSAARLRAAGDAVYAELCERLGEGTPQRRLHATRRAVELLGDPHHAYPIIHLTGTNGKTSTSRMISRILSAHNLRPGLFTSPHLLRFNERIVIDGEPIADADLVRNWEDIKPYVEMTDAALQAEGEQRLTFFETMTVLAFACFADAAVDVGVIEVGMGGEWDSTNVADGQVAVFTPISLDHTATLGTTVAQIARTKSGIVKPDADVVTAAQHPDALAEIRRAVELREASLSVEQVDFSVTSDAVAVGGQLVSVQGRAATYPELFLPLYGAHQAQNLAVAIAAVETFLGRGTQPLNPQIVGEALAGVTSPGRLQAIGSEPTVLADAAHNPAGAATLAAALRDYFDFDELAFVFGVMEDKDVHGIVEELAPLAARFYISQSHTPRAFPHEALSRRVSGWSDPDRVLEFDELDDAIEAARVWAQAAERRAVVVTGSIVLIGEVLQIADDRGWLSRVALDDGVDVEGEQP